MFKRLGFIILAMIISLISVAQPLNARADNVENGGDSLNRGDKEINKSGEEIRDEIKEDQKEVETHDLKDIKEGPGEFYDAYEDEFDEMEEEVPGGSTFVDLMKDYDYQAGNFDCGSFDILCHIVNVTYVGGKSVIDFLLAPISKLAIEPEQVMDDSTFNQFNSYFNTFTYSLLAVFLVFQLLKIYTFRMTNHSDTAGVLNEKIIKVGMAAILLVSYDWFFRLMLSIQYRVNFGIFNYISNSKQITSDLMLNFLVTPNGIVFVIMIILFAILLAILFFQMAYTFALVGLFFTVGPVAIVTMVNDEYNMFSTWLRTLISRFITLALQGLAVMLAFSYAGNMEWIFEGDQLQSTFQKIVALAFLVVGIAIPGLLKEFGNSSGSGRGAITAGRSISRVITRR